MWTAYSTFFLTRGMLIQQSLSHGTRNINYQSGKMTMDVIFQL